MVVHFTLIINNLLAKNNEIITKKRLESRKKQSHKGNML